MELILKFIVALGVAFLVSGLGDRKKKKPIVEPETEIEKDEYVISRVQYYVLMGGYQTRKDSTYENAKKLQDIGDKFYDNENVGIYVDHISLNKKDADFIVSLGGILE